jgi:hypothetical protein
VRVVHPSWLQEVAGMTLLRRIGAWFTAWFWRPVEPSDEPSEFEDVDQLPTLEHDPDADLDDVEGESEEEDAFTGLVAGHR